MEPNHEEPFGNMSTPSERWSTEYSPWWHGPRARLFLLFVQMPSVLKERAAQDSLNLCQHDKSNGSGKEVMITMVYKLHLSHTFSKHEHPTAAICKHLGQWFAHIAFLSFLYTLLSMDLFISEEATNRRFFLIGVSLQYPYQYPR